MPITSFKRTEIKFLITRKQMQAVQKKLPAYMEPDKYCRDGAFYSIYNIYFDTDDNTLIRASVAKPAYKEKLRLRTYASPAGPGDKVFLELKKKTNGVVHKRRAGMTMAEAEAFLQKGVLPPAKDYAQEQILRELAFFLEQNKVQPAAYISYKRMAFFGREDSSLRVTFDFDITTRRQDLTLRSPSYGLQLLEPEHFLMEVKFTGAVPFWLAQLLGEQDIYKTSFSKYGKEFEQYCLSHKDGLPAPELHPAWAGILQPELQTQYSRGA